MIPLFLVMRRAPRARAWLVRLSGFLAERSLSHSHGRSAVLGKEPAAAEGEKGEGFLPSPGRQDRARPGLFLLYADKYFEGQSRSPTNLG